MKNGSIPSIKSKEISQTIQELKRVIYNFIPAFGKLTDLASY